MIPSATLGADRRRAAILATAVGIAGLGAAAALGALGGAAYAPAVAIAAAAGALVWAQLRTMRHLQSCAAEHYRQLEALSGLYSSLQIRVPLPPMRNHAMSPDFARELVALALAERPRTIVELGSGVSTLLTAYALESIGDREAHIYSLDHEEQFASITRGNLATHGLAGWATVLDAPLVETLATGETRLWYEIASLEAALGERRIDLLIVDGPPARDDPLARAPAMPALRDRLADRAVILMDDTGRSGERQIVERWLATEPGFEVRWLPVEKGAAILSRAKAGLGAGRAAAELQLKPSVASASTAAPA